MSAHANFKQVDHMSTPVELAWADASQNFRLKSCPWGNRTIRRVLESDVWNRTIRRVSWNRTMRRVLEIGPQPNRLCVLCMYVCVCACVCVSDWSAQYSRGYTLSHHDLRFMCWQKQTKTHDTHFRVPDSIPSRQIFINEFCLVMRRRLHFLRFHGFCS